MDIHILCDGEQIGPCTEATVREMLREGKVAPTDFAWTAGRDDWEPLAALLPNRPEESEAAEPATARQRAFLAYMVIPFTAETSRDEAARLVNDAMEHPSDPSRLSRWTEERLLLHPEIFAAEIQARKENRAQRYLQIYLEQGTPFFDKVTKAHCQVLVAHLDVHFPLWDADERIAPWKYFFPALAEKFPQLATLEGRSKFGRQERQDEEAKIKRSAALKTSSPSSSPVSTFMALVRGVFIGFLVLGVLWVGFQTWQRWPFQLGDFLKSEAAAAPSPSPIVATPVVAENQPAPAAPASTTAEAPAPERPEAAPAPTAAMPAEAPATTETPAVPAPIAVVPAPAPRTTVTLTKPMEVTLAYGKVTVPAGTSVRIVERNGGALTVSYLDKLIVIPASNTDLNSDPSSAAFPMTNTAATTANR